MLQNETLLPSFIKPCSGEIYVFTDGGSRGNPGPAATGVVIYNDCQLLWQRGTYLGKKTNNEAEYLAVIEAIKWLVDFFSNFEYQETYHTVNFYLDSQLVVQQITGAWKIKDLRMLEYCRTCHNLLTQIKNTTINFKHIPREENIKADALVNEVLDYQQLS